MQFLLSIFCAFLAIVAVNGRGVRNQPGKVNLTSNADSYTPCKRQIIIAYDFSMDLSADNYKKLQNFIDNELFTNFNHFERLAFGPYAKYAQISDPGTYVDVDGIRETVDGILQNRGNSDITNIFKFLSQNQYPTTEMSQTIILLVGKFTDDDAKSVDQYAEILKHFAYLSVIGVQGGVNVKTLDKVADYSYSFDISQGIPKKIQDVIREAHGCDS